MSLLKNKEKISKFFFQVKVWNTCPSILSQKCNNSRWNLVNLHRWSMMNWKSWIKRRRILKWSIPCETIFEVNPPIFAHNTDKNVLIIQPWLGFFSVLCTVWFHATDFDYGRNKLDTHSLSYFIYIKMYTTCVKYYYWILQLSQLMAAKQSYCNYWKVYKFLISSHYMINDLTSFLPSKKV